MWGKIMIPMYSLWLHSLYGLNGPRCPLSPERLLNIITYSLTGYSGVPNSRTYWNKWTLDKIYRKKNGSTLVCHTNLLLTITCTDNYFLGKSADWDMRHANNRWCPGITGHVSVTCTLFNTNHFYRSKLFHFSKNTDLHTIMDRRGTYSMFLTYLIQFLDLNGRFFCFFNDNSEQKISALAQKLPDLL